MGYKFHAERPTDAIEFKEANREAISDFKITQKDFCHWEVTFDSHLELEELKSLIGEIDDSMGETLERHMGIKQYNPQNTITEVDPSEDTPYCGDCGGTDLSYIDQYANGSEWRCKACGKQFIH